MHYFTGNPISLKKKKRKKVLPCTVSKILLAPKIIVEQSIDKVDLQSLKEKYSFRSMS
jgi:hypothetical protein